MYGRIYCITNLVNGKRYVGQTTFSIEQRWSGHCQRAVKGKGSALHAAIRKYGAENFSLMLLGVAADQKELDSLEVRWIFKLQTISPAGYNLNSGGLGGKLHEDTKRRIGEANKKSLVAAWRDPAKRANWIRKQAQTRTVEAQQKRSDSLKVAWNSLSQEDRERRIREARNALRSSDGKAKIAAARTPEWRKRVGDASRGRKHSAQWRREASERQLGKKRGPYNRTVSKDPDWLKRRGEAIARGKARAALLRVCKRVQNSTYTAGPFVLAKQ